MAAKQRNIRLEDEEYAWISGQAALKGISASQFVKQLIEGARAGQAATEVQETGAPVLQKAVATEMRINFEALLDKVQPTLDLILLETVRGRMTGEDVLCLNYDSTNIECPWCGKPYAPHQNGPSYTAQRSEYIKDRARDALAAGSIPTVRGW